MFSSTPPLARSSGSICCVLGMTTWPCRGGGSGGSGDGESLNRRGGKAAGEAPTERKKGGGAGAGVNTTSSLHMGMHALAACVCAKAGPGCPVRPAAPACLHDVERQHLLQHLPVSQVGGARHLCPGVVGGGKQGDRGGGVLQQRQQACGERRGGRSTGGVGCAPMWEGKPPGWGVLQGSSPPASPTPLMSPTRGLEVAQQRAELGAVAQQVCQRGVAGRGGGGDDLSGGPAIGGAGLL